ncbi:MAG: GcrA family cell cycle regulator [Microvirga sp.]
MNAHWDKQRMEVLTRLWLAGATARMIAEKLGGGVTRNAVIGKAHRLGLTGKHGSRSLKRVRAFRPKGSDQQRQREPKTRAHS